MIKKHFLHLFNPINFHPARPVQNAFGVRWTRALSNGAINPTNSINLLSLTTILVIVLFFFGSVSTLRAEIKSIPLHIDEPAGVNRIAYPVTIGLPFPEGELNSSDNVRLLDAQGNEVPLQVKVLMKYPEINPLGPNTIAWLLLDFQMDLEASQQETYTLQYGPRVTRQPIPSQIEVAETDQEIMVDTNKLKFTVNKNIFSFIDQVWLDMNNDGVYEESEQIVTANSDKRYVC